MGVFFFKYCYYCPFQNCDLLFTSCLRIFSIFSGPTIAYFQGLQTQRSSEIRHNEIRGQGGAPLESARLARGHPRRVKVGSGASQVAVSSSCQVPAPLLVILSVRPSPECPQSGLSVPPSFLPRTSHCRRLSIFGRRSIPPPGLVHGFLGLLYFLLLKSNQPLGPRSKVTALFLVASMLERFPCYP